MGCQELPLLAARKQRKYGEGRVCWELPLPARNNGYGGNKIIRIKRIPEQPSEPHRRSPHNPCNFSVSSSCFFGGSNTVMLPLQVKWVSRLASTSSITPSRQMFGAIIARISALTIVDNFLGFMWGRRRLIIPSPIMCPFNNPHHCVAKC